MAALASSSTCPPCMGATTDGQPNVWSLKQLSCSYYVMSSAIWLMSDGKRFGSAVALCTQKSIMHLFTFVHCCFAWCVFVHKILATFRVSWLGEDADGRDEGARVGVGGKGGGWAWKVGRCGWEWDCWGWGGGQHSTHHRCLKLFLTIKGY